MWCYKNIRPQRDESCQKIIKNKETSNKSKSQKMKAMDPSVKPKGHKTSEFLHFSPGSDRVDNQPVNVSKNCKRRDNSLVVNKIIPLSPNTKNQSMDE